MRETILSSAGATISGPAFTRRSFLQKGMTLISTAATVPVFVQRSALGITNPLDVMLTSSVAGVPEDRVLVVVQLAGGNDGLNTVVPFGNDSYYRLRPGLGVRENNVLKITEADGIGFHPSLTGFKELYDEGMLATVQGVGYPNPNRSHFISTDIWHTADPSKPNSNGWIGRYFDAACRGEPEASAGIVLGATAPRAMVGDRTSPVSFESPDLFRWIGQDLHESLAEPYDEVNRAGVMSGTESDSQLAFLTRTALDAQVASEQIRSAVRRPSPAEYPRTALAGDLGLVAAMIRANLSTRVYYVTMGGFDTHAGQAGRHANLLRQLGDSLLAFYLDLEQQGNAARVLTMTFSEFGRRVGENASGGTDHGTAAPMFLIGPMVKPGILGTHPSLATLDSGDLVFTLDFRCVYAAILENWMKTQSEPILRKKFRPASVLDLRD